MKIGIYADPHVSQTSSIITSREGSYSGRLNNLIKSFTWMDKLFKDEGCDEIICLGDLVDRPLLSAEEITALSEFPGINDHIMIVGNHCRSNADGSLNMLSLFKRVYSEPEVLKMGGINILLLPYNKEVYDLSQYKNIDVIMSHNDIKGYNYGNAISQTGYDVTDIQDNCKLFINGHLHNGGWLINNRVVNIGQLSGMNFSSCGGQWEPSVGILDTDTLNLEIITNPYAYRFKKESFKTLVELKNYINALPDEGEYVLQVKIPEKSAEGARKVLDKSKKIVASRILTIRDKKPIKISNTNSDLNVSKSIYDRMRDFLSSQDNSKFNPSLAEEIISSIEKKEGAL